MTRVYSYSIPDPGVETSLITDPSVANGDISRYSPDFAKIVETAADLWERAADVLFVEVEDDGLPYGTGTQGEVRFFLVDRFGSGAIAKTIPEYESPASLDILLAEQGNGARFSDSFFLTDLIVHELGHVIGVPHSDQPDSPPFNPDDPGAVYLSPHEIDTARSIHGASLADDDLMDGKAGLVLATYRAALDREAGSKGFVFWHGHADPVAGILASAECDLDTMSAETVETVYQRLLLRDASDEEVAYWTGRTDDVGQFIELVADSPECVGVMVDAYQSGALPI